MDNFHLNNSQNLETTATVQAQVPSGHVIAGEQPAGPPQSAPTVQAKRPRGRPKGSGKPLGPRPKVQKAPERQATRQGGRAKVGEQPLDPLPKPQSEPAAQAETPSGGANVGALGLSLVASPALGLAPDAPPGNKYPIVSWERVDYVKYLIEHCIILYMRKEDVIDTLFKRDMIDPILTKLVWERMELDNSEFFRSYNVSLEAVRQVNLFNILLKDQANAMKIMQRCQMEREQDQNQIQPSMTVNSTEKEDLPLRPSPIPQSSQLGSDTIFVSEGSARNQEGVTTLQPTPNIPPSNDQLVSDDAFRGGVASYSNQQGVTVQPSPNNIPPPNQLDFDAAFGGVAGYSNQEADASAAFAVNNQADNDMLWNFGDGQEGDQIKAFSHCDNDISFDYPELQDERPPSPVSLFFPKLN